MRPMVVAVVQSLGDQQIPHVWHDFIIMGAVQRGIVVIDVIENFIPLFTQRLELSSQIIQRQRVIKPRWARLIVHQREVDSFGANQVGHGVVDRTHGAWDGIIQSGGRQLFQMVDERHRRPPVIAEHLA